MIPRTVADVDLSIEEAERQRIELRELLAPLSPQARSWRPNERKWSILGHVAHLCVVNRPYLTTFADRIAAARSAGAPVGDGPYRHPLLASWFARTMEPPPKRRIRTFRSMVPEPEMVSDLAGRRFDDLQAELVGTLGDARGLDLGRIRFGSPFTPLMRLSLGTAFEVVLAHNRRHLWLMNEVRTFDGFPGA